MTAEFQNPDAQAKSLEIAVSEPPLIAVFEYTRNPIFPQARIIYVRQVKSAEPSAETVAQEPIL